MKPSSSTRSATRWISAVWLAGVLVASVACNGEGNRVTPPSAGGSVSRPAASQEKSPAPSRPERSEIAVPTREPAPTGTAVAPPTGTAAPPQSAPAPPVPTTQAPPRTPPTTGAAAVPPAATTPPAAATPTPTLSAAGTASSGGSGGLGAFGWFLLIALVAALIGGLVIWRVRRKSGWDNDAAAAETDTRRVVAARLPQVLTTQTTGERALSWPPLRADLTGLLARWDALAERASDDERRDRALWVRGLLDDLIAAVDAENEALAAGRDWTLLRPHVDEANRALSAALATQPMSAGPAGRTTYPG